MADYRRLKVWQRAHDLTLEVYRMTTGFPAEERFGLTGQMRRAAVSIAANIAEGSGRGSDADFARFARMSAGSVNELEYHTILAQDLGFTAPDQANLLYMRCEEVRRMLIRFVEKLAAGSR